MGFINRFIVIAGAALLVSPSFGLMWTDYDYLGLYIGEAESNSLAAPSVGYYPDFQDSTRARVGFSFSDEYWPGDSGREWVDVWLESSQVWNDRKVDGTRRYGFDRIWRGLNGFVLADLQDGVIGYNVKVENRRDGKYNDVWLKKANLKALGDEIPDSRAVPDSGASALLLGIGLFGTFLLVPRMARASRRS